MPAVPPPAPPPRGRVLVAEDNADSREMLVSWLRHCGFEVAAATSGTEALEKLGSVVPDLLLLDVTMPGASGLDVLRAVRRRYSPAEVPVVMLTAHAGGDAVVAALGLGANDYVTKPVDLTVLVARIEAQLRVRAAALVRTAPAGTIEAGVVLAGRYVLDARIGRGSYGDVWRARHLGLARPVAVKIMPVGVSTRPEKLVRFRQEAVAGCRVNHPNAAHVLDFEVTADGLAFLVMELLHGHPLGDEMKKGKALDLARVLAVMVPVCYALAAAHEAGIVHRDVKPANIFLHRERRREVPKVLDFGIAKLQDAAVEQAATAEGWIVGTPTYMAPERFTGAPCDGRTDVYSVGVMLYQMLSGRLPFGSGRDPVALAHAHVNREPPPFEPKDAAVTPEIRALVLAALQKDREARPTMVELADRLVAATGFDRRGFRARRPRPGQAG